MIRIARQTDYAARIVLHLASVDAGTSVSIPEIAQQRLLPVPFVRRLVGRLVKAGIVATARGQKGGIRLARPARDITLLDVVRAMEGPIALNHCLESAHTCPFSNKCPVQVAWAEATQALESALSSIRFDTLGLGLPAHADAHRRLRPRAKN